MQPDPWLAFGCDSFVDAMPAKMQASNEGVVFAADGEVSVDVVAEIIAMAMPEQDYERVLETLIRWGRFGNLFAYDEEKRRLGLQ